MKQIIKESIKKNLFLVVLYSLNSIFVNWYGRGASMYPNSKRKH